MQPLRNRGRVRALLRIDFRRDYAATGSTSPSDDGCGRLRCGSVSPGSAARTVMLTRDALARRHRALVWAALVGWLIFACLFGIDLLGVWDVPAWLPAVLIMVVIVVQVLAVIAAFARLRNSQADQHPDRPVAR